MAENRKQKVKQQYIKNIEKEKQNFKSDAHNILASAIRSCNKFWYGVDQYMKCHLKSTNKWDDLMLIQGHKQKYIDYRIQRCLKQKSDQNCIKEAQNLYQSSIDVTKKNLGKI